MGSGGAGYFMQAVVGQWSRYRCHGNPLQSGPGGVAQKGEAVALTNVNRFLVLLAIVSWGGSRRQQWRRRTGGEGGGCLSVCPPVGPTPTPASGPSPLTAHPASITVSVSVSLCGHSLPAVVLCKDPVGSCRIFGSVSELRRRGGRGGEEACGRARARWGERQRRLHQERQRVADATGWCTHCQVIHFKENVSE